MDYEIHTPRNTPVVYVIWLDGNCCHIGDGDVFLRVTTWIILTKKLKTDDLKKMGPDNPFAGYRAVWLYVTDEVARVFAYDVKDKPKQSPSGNVERLLQTLYCWQHGEMPAEDSIRGPEKAGNEGNSTGSFIADWRVIEEACKIYEHLQISQPSRAWPTPCGDKTTFVRSKGEKHLTFHVDLDKDGKAWRFRLGYTYYQGNAGVPQYNHKDFEEEMVWQFDAGIRKWKCRVVN